MLLDHAQVVFPAAFPYYFRYIGRIAFPVYAYMIAQGCKRTGNIGKYLLRLGIFALVSEVPFDIAFRNEISFVSDTNIFYTLFLGTACIAIYEKIKEKLSASKPNNKSMSAQENGPVSGSMSKEDVDSTSGLQGKLDINPASGSMSGSIEKQEVKPASDLLGKPAVGSFKRKLTGILLSALLIIPIAILANLLGTDYGSLGIICILVFYFAKPESRLMRTLAAVGVAIYVYGFPLVRVFMQSGIEGLSIFGSLQAIMTIAPNYMIYFFLFALVSALLLLLYNGKLGPKVKWAFYAFYPVHLAILAAIRYITSQG